jgi:hypothetical protein
VAFAAREILNTAIAIPLPMRQVPAVAVSL